MKKEYNPKVHAKEEDSTHSETNPSGNVYSDIPWEKYMDRIVFSGRLPKNGKTVNRSVTFDSKELRVAEIIREADKRTFQTVSDVIRDSVRKGLQQNYELLVRRKGEIKRKGEFLYKELANVDRELEILDTISDVQNRVEKILKESIKEIAGRGKEWAEWEISSLIKAAESDYPDKGIKEYFHKLLHEPQNVTSILANLAESKKKIKSQG